MTWRRDGTWNGMHAWDRTPINSIDPGGRIALLSIGYAGWRSSFRTNYCSPLVSSSHPPPRGTLIARKLIDLGKARQQQQLGGRAPTPTIYKGSWVGNSSSRIETEKLFASRIYLRIDQPNPPRPQTQAIDSHTAR